MAPQELDQFCGEALEINIDDHKIINLSINQMSSTYEKAIQNRIESSTLENDY